MAYMPNTAQDFVLLNLQAATASGDTFTDPAADPTVGTPADLSDYSSGIVFLNVTDITGTTPTLTIDLYTYDKVAEAWVRFNGFSQVTAAGVVTLELPPGQLPNSVAVKDTIGGTSPSVTADVWIAAKRR